MIGIAFEMLKKIIFQYFVFDFHMAPVMLFDKIISFTVGYIFVVFWSRIKL